MKEYIKLGKFLSLILRHHPEVIGVQLDQNGWADVPEILDGMNRAGHKIDIKVLEEIVATNNKKRYSFNEDKTKIRANQGHSINVDVQLKIVIPPDCLYHGTAERFYDSIADKGLLKQSRNYVHLSEDYETAINVGKRYGKPVVLIINAKSMRDDGYTFFLSENGVWLTDNVPSKYIRR